MTLPTYLDTSAVMDWLEIASASPDEKAARCGPQVESILNDQGRDCTVSDLTLIECFNAVHNAWRDTAQRKAGYDEAWAREAQARLLEAISSTTLTVRTVKPSDIEHALMLVTVVTEAGRKFRAWDALHLEVALDWSREIRKPVYLITSNGDFETFQELHPYVAQHIALIKIA